MWIGEVGGEKAWGGKGGYFGKGYQLTKRRVTRVSLGYLGREGGQASS